MSDLIQCLGEKHGREGKGRDAVHRLFPSTDHPAIARSLAPFDRFTGYEHDGEGGGLHGDDGTDRQCRSIQGARKRVIPRYWTNFCALLQADTCGWKTGFAIHLLEFLLRSVCQSANF